MKRKITRRGFLESATLAASVAFVPDLISGPAAAIKPPPPKRFSSFDRDVRRLLATMSLDEKIGQMTQAEQSALESPLDIEKYFLGSLLCGGSSDPKAGNSLEAWTDMYDRFQSHALKTRLG